MSDSVKCEVCEATGRRPRMCPAPEGWLYLEATAGGDDTMVVYACSREHADKQWLDGPGTRWTAAEVDAACAAEDARDAEAAAAARVVEAAVASDDAEKAHVRAIGSSSAHELYRASRAAQDALDAAVAALRRLRGAGGSEEKKR